MAFTLEKIIFAPILESISVTHTVGFGSSLDKSYLVQNIDANEVKLSIQAPSGITVFPKFIQLAPNQTTTIRVSADRTFFDTLPKGDNKFTIDFQMVGQGDPIDPTSDVIVFELQLTSTPSLSIKVGQQSTVTALVLEKNLTKQTQNTANNKLITFTSANPSIVSVGQLSGVATGVTPGNTEIRVDAAGIGMKRVLVGVYSDPPAPRWWEKVVVNTTNSQRFYGGPYTTNILPFPTREIRDGFTYDVYYVEISEDRMTTTTYYYDWNDVTSSVLSLSDAEKILKGYIASTVKPLAPGPQTVDGNIVRVVTNSKYEQKIVQVDTPVVTPPVSPPPTPSVTPSRGAIPPTPLPSVTSSPLPGITPSVTPPQSQYPPITPPVTPPVTPPQSQLPTPECMTYDFWFDQNTPEIVPEPSVTSIDCNGNIVETIVTFDSTAYNPQKICSRGILSTYRVTRGNSRAGCDATPSPSVTPPPSATSLPPQIITLSVGGERTGGTINGRSSPFSVTVEWGTGYAISMIPNAGYLNDITLLYDKLGQVIGNIVGSDALVYANGQLDEVVAFFKIDPNYGGGTGGTGGTGGGQTRPPILT